MKKTLTTYHLWLLTLEQLRDYIQKTPSFLYQIIVHKSKIVAAVNFKSSLTIDEAEE